MSCFKNIGLYGVLICQAGWAFANTATDLGVVVISATTTEQDLSNAPASISVITQQALQKRPVQDLKDALSGVKSVQFNGVGMSRRGISLRGMPSEHTLVLIDGKRINPSAGAIAHSDFDLNWIPLATIERIEVVRGPMSSLYGSEALGGIVNIITKTPSEDWAGTVRLAGQSPEQHGGQQHQVNGYISGALIPDRLSLSLTGEVQRQQETPFSKDKRLSDLEGNDNHHLGMALRWQLDPTQDLTFDYSQGREERWRNTITAGKVISEYESTDVLKRQQMSLTHDKDWSWGHTQVRGYRNQLQRENHRSAGQKSNDPQKIIGSVVDGQITFDPFYQHRLTVGSEWRKEELEDLSVNSHGQDQAIHRAVFLQDEWQLAQDWSLTLGSRLDQHEAFGWEHSPRAYLMYQFNPDWQMRIGAGRGYKAPSLKQLSASYNSIGGGGRFTIYGNPDLQPETNTTYEWGVEYQQDAFTFGTTLFENQLNDLIHTRCTANCGQRGREQRTYENIDQARIRGLELEMNWAFHSDWQWHGNYTYLDAKNRTGKHRLSDRSRHLLNNTLQWQLTEQLNNQLRHEYIGSQLTGSLDQQYELPSYHLLHWDMNYQLSKNTSVQAGISNLSNKRLSNSNEQFDYTEPGRSYHLSIQVGF
jgi:outer membrane receptor for ferrienterochelin and colicins